MEPKDVIIEGFERIRGLLTRTLADLTVEQLTFKPHPEANTIAWLTWHLTRVQDNHLSQMVERQPLWIADGWHAKFGKAADPKETGMGHGPDQVAAIRPDGPRLLLDYHQAVYEQSVRTVQALSAADMDRVLDDPRFNPPPTVGVRLVSVLSDNLQHAGQAAYVRGCVEGRRWFMA